MATRADAEAGWQIFKGSNFSLTPNEINERLKREGYAPVSPRTYSHYRKLVRYHYDFYIPINQLDVKTLQDPVWDRAIRNRYLTKPLEARVQLTSLETDEVWEGKTVLISEGVVVVRLRADPETFAKLTKKRAPFSVQFEETGEIRQITLENLSFDAESKVLSLRFTFNEFRSGDRLANTQPLPPETLHFTITHGRDQLLLGELVQQVYWIFEAVEATRIACDQVLAELDPAAGRSLSPPSIKSMKLQSPLDLILQGSNPYLLGIVLLVGRLLAYRKKFYEGSVAKEESRKLRWEQDEKEIKAAIGSEEAAALIVRRIRRQLSLDSSKDKPGAAERDLAKSLEDEVLPHLVRLLNAATGLEIEGPDEEDTEDEE